MPAIPGMPLFGLIQMLLGAGVLIFALTKYLLRPKRKKTDGYLIRNVHVIVGGGSELLEAGIYGIEHGILDEALPPDDDAGDRSRREKRRRASRHRAAQRTGGGGHGGGSYPAGEKSGGGYRQHPVRRQGVPQGADRLFAKGNRLVRSSELRLSRGDGDYIRLTGTFQGKAQEKTFKIGDGLWYQAVELAMPAFLASKEKEIVFYSIGTGDNRGAMNLGEFAAQRAGGETIEVEGRRYDCVKLTFVLTAFSWAWTGLCWYDKKSGLLVQTGEKGKGGVRITYQLAQDE